MSDTIPLELERDGEVTTLWLNRPEKRNAVTFEMWSLLPSLLDEALVGEPRVLLVRGRGGHFCAGADIVGLGDRLADAGVPGGYREVNAEAEDALARFPRPTIAVVEGNCIGGGWQIASACDLRVAGRGVTFGITPAKLGITYPVEAVRRTIALVGPATTKRLLFTAELIGGEEASRLGFFDLLVDDEEVERTAHHLAAELQDRSLLTQLATKLLVEAESSGDAGQRAAHDLLELAARQGPDLAEGLAAFAEKRSPRFSWRP